VAPLVDGFEGVIRPACRYAFSDQPVMEIDGISTETKALCGFNVWPQLKDRIRLRQIHYFHNNETKDKDKVK
jgi:hypothetical protein